MGFSVDLQGRAAHEALINRQDAELRLLETMRRCVAGKVKCDREYAAALASVSAQGMKVDRSDELAGSLVAQAWKAMMDEVDNAGRLFRSNADLVEKETLERLNALCQEKRKARKQYQEEHSRILQQFNHLSEEVLRKKSDYQKQIEFYRLMRSRFEEHYVKCFGRKPKPSTSALIECGRHQCSKKPVLQSQEKDPLYASGACWSCAGRGGRKLDDVRDKYQRACRKLHLVHNEYVLLLAEAEVYETEFRTVLLPSLLHQHQTILEAFIVSWRSIMREMARLWNYASRQFVEVNSQMEASIEIIKPGEEYNDFTEKNKTHPTEPIRLSFDKNLVEDSSGKLLANQLTVDNLTVEWVRAKMFDLEIRLKETQEKQANCHLHENSELVTNELRAENKRILRQLDVIKKALNDLGCEELPVGCDLPTIENTFDQNQENHTSDILPPSAKRPSLPSQSLAVSASLVDMLRKPFRRKSVPNSPLLRSAAAACGDDPSSGIGSSTRSLVDEEWFHGVLPREEVVRLLTKEGDFLVRETTRNDENQTVLSVCWGGHKHFIVQTTAEGQFRFEGPAFPTIQELIMYQFQSNLAVTSRSGAVLRTPIPRERWELNNDDVILLEKIGRGNFGDVYKARLRTSNDEEVAVKTCRMTVPDEHKRKFLQEGRILKQYDHPNIVKLIGICVQKQPIMIVMEHVVGGSLLTFLRNNASSLTQKQMLLMCKDAAAGMQYLESKNCIHRDLAARNCLVAADNSVKISDFGMSREEEEYIVSDGMKQIPIKWTAPEALNYGKYTSLCDVWSYGVLTWEVFAKGGTPYPGLTNSKAREKIDSGYRMPAPEGTPDEMYRLMLRCWEYKPENRPHFEQIYSVVDTLCSSVR
ncbi:tyrosine-protein kinase Fer isoform X2 [Nilaparvata lugens]|uniref:tyrosine-protein kinase Fer isoform X2 n=1 Tax=Nilaparvata lugens TaxID=108931 RepID=UPI00193E3950|nr:tyrosine-protein kinase Fer isoform X2 [Nilaparvata lugens]